MSLPSGAVLLDLSGRLPVRLRNGESGGQERLSQGPSDWTWHTTFWLARGGGNYSTARQEQQRPHPPTRIGLRGDAQSGNKR